MTQSVATRRGASRSCRLALAVWWGGTRAALRRKADEFIHPSDLTPQIRPFRNTIWTKEGGRTMSKSRHTEAQIITALKQVEAGRRAEDVAREQGVSKHTIYAWKAKYGGMDVSEAEEVKHLRDENARLKKLVADLSLDKDMLQSVIRKNSLGS